jgi:hypothetical protein
MRGSEGERVAEGVFFCVVPSAVWWCVLGDWANEG